MTQSVVLLFETQCRQKRFMTMFGMKIPLNFQLGTVFAFVSVIELRLIKKGALVIAEIR